MSKVILLTDRTLQALTRLLVILTRNSILIPVVLRELSPEVADYLLNTQFFGRIGCKE